ncbi:hypothetical protein [Hymenobacter sedentarius]|uniref:hypothetical protein n=1 Tax=Hymenobacter sedentarius TaxID=1411621 RepID=UPI000AAFCA74|nr:hypothetical protein [Hymenobacter sedentarius]
MLVKVSSSLAQAAPAAAPAPAPDYEEVSVPVPRAISLITDMTKVVLSREPGRDKV